MALYEMGLLLDHVDCPSACTSQMSLYFVLKCRSTKDDVAQENEYITKSQENEEKMSLANVSRKTIIQTKKQYTRTAFGDGILKESQG